jgi:hypothetical protein
VSPLPDNKPLPTIALVVVIGMLVWALVPFNPYPYYILLRWVCCPTLAYLAWLASTRGQTNWALGFGIGALIYNPIIRVALSKGIWTAINVVTIAALVMFTLRVARVSASHE